MSLLSLVNKFITVIIYFFSEEGDFVKLYELERVNVTYNSGESKVQAIRDISLAINPGEIISIIGPSGAGKSTLLNVLSGLEKFSDGKVYYKGIDMSKLNQKKLAELRLQNFGYVFQGFYLIATMTVQDNIWLPAIVDKGNVDLQLYEEIIADLSLSDRIKHLPNQLSGGEKQRVAIARALINKPSVIFADEPTGNLDSVNGEKVFELLFRCAKKYKQTLIFVTHDAEKSKLAERSFLIKDGVLIV